MDGWPRLLFCPYYVGSHREVWEGQGHRPQRKRRERLHSRIRHLRGQRARTRPDHQLRHEPLGRKRHQRQCKRGRRL